MAGEAIAPLEGLPALLTGAGLSVAETDKQMGKNQLKNVLMMAKVAAQLAKELNLPPDSIMDIFKALSSRSIRAGAAEIMIKGDVNVARRLEVEGGLALRFAPFASLNLAGAYSSNTTQAWGAEVRLSLVVLPEEPQYVADFIQRFQERGLDDPEILRTALPDIFPLIKDLLVEPNTPVTEPEG